MLQAVYLYAITATVFLGLDMLGIRYIVRPVFEPHVGHLLASPLRHDRRDTPRGVDSAMNGGLFDLWVEAQLAPTLRRGDVIIRDNLSSHQSPKAAEVMRDVGA